jgi:hypothetical protein
MVMGSSAMKNYIITFDKQNSQIGFNGQPIGFWRKLFRIFELVMIGLGVGILGLGAFMLVKVRINKKNEK